MRETKIKEMLGKVFKEVVHRRYDREVEDEVLFILDDDHGYRMYHSQDCCETVSLAEIIGDLSDLVGVPIALAEESSSDEDAPAPEGGEKDCGNPDFGPCKSHTWTFYRFATSKGPVVFRWHGSSNGYYSESVEIEPF